MVEVVPSDLADVVIAEAHEAVAALEEELEGLRRRLGDVEASGEDPATSPTDGSGPAGEHLLGLAGALRAEAEVEAAQVIADANRRAAALLVAARPADPNATSGGPGLSSVRVDQPIA